MEKYFLIKFRLLPFALAFLFIITACGPSIKVTATTPSPTSVPPTATMTASLTAEPTQTVEPTATSLPEIDLNIALPEGDAQKGFTTAIRYSCHGCHVNELHPTSGPRFAADTEMPFILERGTMRIALPEYEGRATTDQEYMIESIFQPEAYIVTGKWKEPMPTTFQQRMSDQELADILAWMATLK